MLEKETKYFESKLAELQKTEMNKFVLIKDDSVIGSYVALADALKDGYEKLGTQPFFIKQVLPTQQPLNFANNYFVV